MAGEILKPGQAHRDLPADAGEATIARVDKLRNAKGSLTTAQIRKSMQRIMQNNAAVFRTSESLKEGVQLIDECVKTFKDVKVRVANSSSAWSTSDVCGVFDRYAASLWAGASVGEVFLNVDVPIRLVLQGIFISIPKDTDVSFKRR